MTAPDALSTPVYRAARGVLSILDLLRRFADPALQSDGVCRLSDLHLKVGRPAMYRLDNDLDPVAGGEALTAQTIAKLVFPLLTRDQVARLTGEPPQDVDAAFDQEDLGLSFRINAFHDRDGLACAIRALPRRVPAVETIGLPAERTWREIVDMRQGLVIITGITGSGKSTTVASFLQHINEHRRVRIITLEDPIEYVLTGRLSLISQRELGRHIRSFQEGLRSALREDPDILFVGEMRDSETTSLALTAAETGHVVFSTLHTKDARGAITRIVDMFPSDRLKELSTQLSFSLSYILAQKLVPRADGKGRRLAVEVLRSIPAIASQIRSGNWHQIYSAMQTHRREGLSTLEHHLKALAEAGEIEQTVALRYANDPTALGGAEAYL